MRHTLSVFLLLSVIWLANSGHYTALLLALGLLSILFVLWLSRRMDAIDQEPHDQIHLLKLPGYALWLFAKVVQSNIDVIKCVWSPSTINPSSSQLPLSFKSDLGKAIYANSITLTPGTLSVDVQAGEITVHALTKAGLEELQAGEMARKVQALER